MSLESLLFVGAVITIGLLIYFLFRVADDAGRRGLPWLQQPEKSKNRPKSKRDAVVIAPLQDEMPLSPEELGQVEVDRRDASITHL